MNRPISHILLDIEGTTCPVSFVSNTLFPYAVRELGPYLQRHHLDAKIQDLVETVHADWQQDPEAVAQQLWRSAEIAVVAKHLQIIPYLQWLIRVDRKYTPLKELQGMVWNAGYRRGELKSTLFADVPTALKRWHEQGLILAVYSSGSVAAQKLLYGHSQAGDLCPLFSHWFDTHIGGKHEEASYGHICNIMQAHPQQVLFVSDSAAELRAASNLNLKVIYSDRDHIQIQTQTQGNQSTHGDTITIDGQTYVSISSLEQINPSQLRQLP